MVSGDFWLWFSFLTVIATYNIFTCTVNSKINGTPKGTKMPISKLHSILAVANLLAYNNFMVMLLWASKFATTKIKCSFEMGK